MKDLRPAVSVPLAVAFLVLLSAGAGLAADGAAVAGEVPAEVSALPAESCSNEAPGIGGVPGIDDPPKVFAAPPWCTQYPGCTPTCQFGGPQPCDQLAPSYCYLKCKTVCENPNATGYCNASSGYCYCSDVEW